LEQASIVRGGALHREAKVGTKCTGHRSLAGRRIVGGARKERQEGKRGNAGILDRCSPGLAYAAYHLVNPYFSLIEFATNSASTTKASIVGFSFDSDLTFHPERTSEQVLAGGTTEGAKTLETLDRSVE